VAFHFLGFGFSPLLALPTAELSFSACQSWFSVRSWHKSPPAVGNIFETLDNIPIWATYSVFVALIL